MSENEKLTATEHEAKAIELLAWSDRYAHGRYKSHVPTLEEAKLYALQAHVHATLATIPHSYELTAGQPFFDPFTLVDDPCPGVDVKPVN